MDLVSEIIDSKETFHALQNKWDRLHAQCSGATIFSSWDWLYTWWEVFETQANRKLFIICLYHADELVGIAPFQIVKTYPKSMIQGKTLCFIGSGENKKDQVVSEYLDLIINPEYETEALNTFADVLVDNKRHWNFADFEYLLEDALILQCFATRQQQISTRKMPYGKRYFVSGFKNFDEYTSQMGKRWQKMLVKKSRALERDGQMIIRSTKKDEPTEEAFERLDEMHEARWKDRTGVNIFKSEYFNAFHKMILERLAPQGRACIKTLFIDDEALATYYYFSDKGQVHYYQSGFFSEHANRYSPLFLLVCQEVGRCIKENKMFDFMFSDEDSSYKEAQYAASYAPMYRLRWAHGNKRFLLLDCAKYLQNKMIALKNKNTFKR